MNLVNPVFTANRVTDIDAKFVADPFLMRESGIWYLFFEAYNIGTQQGDLAVATSTNLWSWNYEQVILDEPFHLSYPNVFGDGDNYYLVPESHETDSVRLYRATQFPTDWEFVGTLIDGRPFVDNSIIFHEGRWWMFSCTTSSDTLYLFYAEDLTGPWVEHPASPIVENDVRTARPSGRMLSYDDHLYRFAMDLDPAVGTHQVVALEILEMTPSDYSERYLQTNPILSPDGKGWNASAMHQIAPVQLDGGYWVASIDGFGNHLIFGWQY